ARLVAGSPLGRRHGQAHRGHHGGGHLPGRRQLEVPQLSGADELPGRRQGPPRDRSGLMTRATAGPRYTPAELATLLGLRFPPTVEQAAIISAPMSPLLVVAGAG